MRSARLLLVAALAAGGFALATPATAGPYCDTFPEACDYECVTYPCYPDDWAEYVIDRLPLDGSGA